MLSAILIFAALVNLVGALGPELGFDALWYHLTIPKLYLMWGRIDFIPGGLLYYSAMPRLGEFLFLGAMRVMGEAGDLGAHLISWLAGIGAAFVTYKIARKYLDQKFSLLAAVIFYATPLLGWLSGSAYVDLIRTFFEALVVYWLLEKKFVMAGTAAGLAIGTKTLAIGSLAILFVLSGFNFSFLLPAVFLGGPWFIWAWQKTGYPFYPLGAGILNTNEHSSLSGLFTENKLNPLFFLAFLNRTNFFLWAYTLATFLFWLVTPQGGGGRYLLPYLPVYAVLATQMISKKRWLVALAGVFVVFSIAYRSAANVKIIPYLTGKETRTEYLCKNLDFSTAVFVDCDGWFAENIKSSDLVLVKGFHNLYYVDFPFVDETWYKGEKTDYTLIYGRNESHKGNRGTKIYENQLTGAIIYKTQ